MIWILALAVLPAPSNAVTVMVLVPPPSDTAGTLQLTRLLLRTSEALPLPPRSLVHATRTTPTLSLAAPYIEVLTALVTAPERGDVMLTAGLIVSAARAVTGTAVAATARPNSSAMARDRRVEIEFMGDCFRWGMGVRLLHEEHRRQAAGRGRCAAA